MLGRTLSGQTTETFITQLRHVKPLSFGLGDGALGKDGFASICPLKVICVSLNIMSIAHPNAGLPDAH